MPDFFPIVFEALSGIHQCRIRLGEGEMTKNHQQDYSAAELDQDLLATPFKIQTKWHVITGAPCSGKSTLINQLEEGGFKTAPEAARMYYEREMDTGRTMDEIRSDVVPLVNGIVGMTLEIERGLNVNEVIFLDRGYPDALGFIRQVGLNPDEYLPDCFHHRYASVILLDRFPAQQDGVRVEDDAASEYLDEWHERDYITLGYKVVRIPVMPPQERYAFFLEKLSEQELQ